MSQSFHERRGAHRPSGLGPAGAVPWLIAAVAVVLIVAYASGWWGGGQDGTTVSSGDTSQSDAGAGSTKTSTTKAATKPATPSSTKQPTAPASTATQAPTVDHGQSVSVLNSTRRSGLAASAAGKLKNQGWTIRATGNYTGSVSGTTVFYGKGSLSATAQAVADDLGAPAAVQESADFGASRVTVVLGADYPS